MFPRLMLLLLSVFLPALVARAGEPVAVQLKWRHQFQFAGYYAALEKGFYAREGLDVRLIEGGPGRAPVDALLRGRADYAVADASALLYRARGEPVVVLASIFQHSPLVLLCRESIGTIADLKGRRLMLQRGHAAEILAMLQQQGLRESDFRRLPTSSDIQDLVDGRTDAFAAYETNEPFILSRKGAPYRMFRPRDYGVDFYGDTLVTTETEIRNHPERVAAFRRATLLGWRYALDHPDEIIDLIKRKYDTQHKTRAHLAFEAQGVRELMMADVIPIGFSNPERWQAIAQTFKRLGMPIGHINRDAFLYRPTPSFGEFLREHAAGAIMAGALLALLLATGYILMLLRGRARMEQLLADMPVPLFVSRLDDGSMIFANGQARAFSRNEDLGPHCSTLDFYANPEERRRIVREVVEKGGVTGHEVNLRLADGRECWVSLSSRRIRFEGHDAMINVIQDITETVMARDLLRDVNRELEARVARRTKELLNANARLRREIRERERIEEERRRLASHLAEAQKMESIGVLAGGVAHDFNNLLAAIMGNAELALMEMEQGNMAVEDYLQPILVAAERGAELVRQMLAYAGKGGREHRPVLLRDIIHETVDLARAGLGSRIELLCGVGDPEDMSAVVIGDANQLMQVIMNLLANAAESYEGGAGVVQLCCGATTLHGNDVNRLTFSGDMTEGRYVWIEVRDKGRGMDSNTMSRIFDPFFTTKEAGTGLGLAAVLGIVRDHKGGIDVTSAPGRGSRFRLFLPLRDAPLLPERGVAARRLKALPEFQGVALIVDDEAGVRRVGRKMLETLGLTVHEAASGAAAMGWLAAHDGRVDVVLLDYSMPGMNGAETFRALRDAWPETRVVLCSGLAEGKVARHLRQSGLSGFVQKPYSIHRLAETLAPFFAPK